MTLAWADCALSLIGDFFIRTGLAALILPSNLARTAPLLYHSLSRTASGGANCVISTAELHPRRDVNAERAKAYPRRPTLSPTCATAGPVGSYACLRAVSDAAPGHGCANQPARARRHQCGYSNGILQIRDLSGSLGPGAKRPGLERSASLEPLGTDRYGMGRHGVSLLPDISGLRAPIKH